ncbi:hypothetical protein LC612_39715, partial [Nostoc sp. CHAB 5834]|nr:hypothetical protein [Nostoc sp. CHAB 5834]
MFSLVIVIFSIALVAVLALVVMYYGGSAMGGGAAKAEASKLINQGQQIMGAADLYKSDTGDWPPTLESLVLGKYLKAMPEGSNGNSWVMPKNSVPTFVLAGVQKSACKTVNAFTFKSDGVRDRLSASYATQCYAPAPDSFSVVVTKAGEYLSETGSCPAGTTATGLPGLGSVECRPAPSDCDDPSWVVKPGYCAGPNTPEDPNGPIAPNPDSARVLYIVDGRPVNVVTIGGQTDDEYFREVWIENVSSGPITFSVEGWDLEVPFELFPMYNECLGVTLQPREGCTVGIYYHTPETSSTGHFRPPVANGPLHGIPLTGVKAPPVNLEYLVDGVPVSTVIITPDSNYQGYVDVEVRNASSQEVYLDSESWDIDRPFIIAPAPYNECAGRMLLPQETCFVTIRYQGDGPSAEVGPDYRLTPPVWVGWTQGVSVNTPPACTPGEGDCPLPMCTLKIAAKTLYTKPELRNGPALGAWANTNRAAWQAGTGWTHAYVEHRGDTVYLDVAPSVHGYVDLYDAEDNGFDLRSLVSCAPLSPSVWIESPTELGYSCDSLSYEAVDLRSFVDLLTWGESSPPPEYLVYDELPAGICQPPEPPVFASIATAAVTKVGATVSSTMSISNYKKRAVSVAYSSDDLIIVPIGSGCATEVAPQSTCEYTVTGVVSFYNAQKTTGLDPRFSAVGLLNLNVDGQQALSSGIPLSRVATVADIRLIPVDNYETSGGVVAYYTEDYGSVTVGPWSLPAFPRVNGVRQKVLAKMQLTNTTLHT